MLKGKKIAVGISLKLFFAFWLVIISSVLISQLIAVQFRERATQEAADQQQILLLTAFRDKLAQHPRINLTRLQQRFYRMHQQHLIIKNISTQQISLPDQRPWRMIKDYLENHQLLNPVSINFNFTQLTGASEIELNGERLQLFVAPAIDHKRLTGFLAFLPLSLRILLISLISFIACWLLAKTFSRPLIAIEKASHALGQGDLTTRLSGFEQRSDEFGAVARSFNQMAAQLENNISAHQRLLCDVSHELRSPLTRLQLAVSLVEKNIGHRNEQQKHLNRCEDEIDCLDEMIADVLTLSRLEHSHYSHDVEEVDLTTLVQHIIVDCQYLANDKQITIDFITDGQCTLLADKKLLVSAIANVLNNAVKYSPVQCNIEVKLTMKKEQVQLTISDQGQGVPEHMLARLFTPFFRTADGRERNSGGTGLGLAIAQQAIEQHQGQIYAKNQKSAGLKIYIKLPFTTDTFSGGK